MLLGGIVSDQQNSGSSEDVRHAGRGIGLAAKGSCQGREVGGAVVIHIVRFQDHTGKLR